MDGLKGPSSTTAISAVDSNPPSPPLDPDFSPVGSPEHDIPDVPVPPSDDDHDHDHCEDPIKDHENSSTPAVLTDDLKQRIIKQVEYYFSDENLPTDKYMMNLIRKNKEGFVPISVIASFRKLKRLTRNHAWIVAALRESSLLVVSSNGKKVKRLNPLPVTEVRDPKLFTVLVENLPEDHSVENMQRIFAEAGKIKSICIRDPNVVEESKKSSKYEFLVSNKLHAFVEYETVEAAEKAVATLNDEQDWRNGLRVKLRKRMGNYGQRRQAWRGSDSEKNNSGRTSDPAGDEELQNLNDLHDDTPDEEEGEHLSNSKEKNDGQKGRNRGRSRRQRYRGGPNGLGHGTTSSHALEPPKPPPGPRMPDGSRGFSMGRGRPPISNQS